MSITCLTGACNHAILACSMPERIAKRMHQTIATSARVLLVPHKDPDGDTLGATCAMAEYLKKIGKPHRIFCKTPVSKKLLFLPHADRVEHTKELWVDPFDCIVVFDSGSLAYAGIAEEVNHMKKRPTMIDIDHHPTNEYFGDLNLVLTHASSTAEIMYGWFLANHIRINAIMATALLTGIITDTGHFTNAATNNTTLRIAADLIRAGGKITDIRNAVIKDRSIGGLRAWGAALARMTYHKELNIVSAYLTQNDLAAQDVDDAEVEGIANFLNMVEDGCAALFLKEKEPGVWKGSFRTTKDGVDVSAWAMALGGGGHKKAAGFTIEGSKDEAFEKIWKVIEKY